MIAQIVERIRMLSRRETLESGAFYLAAALSPGGLKNRPLPLTEPCAPEPPMANIAEFSKVQGP
jgi:hypothetical protein